jgi:hypothetical protein
VLLGRLVLYLFRRLALAVLVLVVLVVVVGLVWLMVILTMLLMLMLMLMLMLLLLLLLLLLLASHPLRLAILASNNTSHGTSHGTFHNPKSSASSTPHLVIGTRRCSRARRRARIGLWPCAPSGRVSAASEVRRRRLADCNFSRAGMNPLRHLPPGHPLALYQSRLG